MDSSKDSDSDETKLQVNLKDLSPQAQKVLGVLDVGALLRVARGTGAGGG